MNSFFSNFKKDKESEDKCLYIPKDPYETKIDKGIAMDDYMDYIHNLDLDVQILTDLDNGIYRHDRDFIDYIGCSEEYLSLLNKSGLKFNYIDFSTDPSEIESKMLSDILLAVDLPDDLTENIKSHLSDTKKMYVRKIVDRSEIYPEVKRHR